ncbi:serine/threonine-protein kinase STY46-like isoform X1 [Ipomoea triloba]|uniref:serine/threonine-protein kinase STY46-like isoform X1 n=1 Tax=Ipomoea triloba TaxID=35885 RepID=UPI00125E19A7|nr:serine/threonine-protein kinase STY46-like isoform X1 [Ipomoea triloba]
MEDVMSCSSSNDYRPPPPYEAAPTTQTARKRRGKAEVFHDVLRRLRESSNEEASQPGFEDELWTHFSKLPLRYALDVNTERAQDVIMHKKLLHLARNRRTRPAIEVRLVQMHPVSDANCGDSVHCSSLTRGAAQGIDDHGSIHPPLAFGLTLNLGLTFDANKPCVEDGNSAVSGHSRLFRNLHELTISTLDKPKLLSQLTSLLSKNGLNIQEAHAFSTTDGYSLDVFVVDGWAHEEIDQLKNSLVAEIQEFENQSVSRQDLISPDVELDRLKPHSEVAPDATDVWEIDPKLLKFERKITSGDVYKGSFRSQDVAIKVLRAELINEDTQRDFAQEIYILRKVRHKNIVQFIGACTRPPLLCIVTEYMSGGSVYDFLHKQKGVFKLPAILKVAIDVSKGMSYLHGNKIIHRDLKAANLLLDENLVVKIADFGIARLQVESGVMTAETGTYRWMAPEVIGHRPYDHKADVFSFGILMWELLTGKLPYEHLTPLQAAVGVSQKGLRPTIPEGTHPMLADLLKRCWDQDSLLRPEFSDITEDLQRISNVVAEQERNAKRRNLEEPHKVRGKLTMKAG